MTRSSINGDQFDVKLDANLTGRDRLSGRFSWCRQDIPTSNSFPLLFDNLNSAHTRNGVVNWTLTVDPSLVNEVRVGVNYVWTFGGDHKDGVGNLAEQLGIQNGNDRGPGLMALLSPEWFIGSANTPRAYLFADTVIQLEDGLIMTEGQAYSAYGFPILATTNQHVYSQATRAWRGSSFSTAGGRQAPTPLLYRGRRRGLARCRLLSWASRIAGTRKQWGHMGTAFQCLWRLPAG